MNAAVHNEIATLAVRPLSAHIGADIRGVDLSRPLPAEQIEQIRAALLRWKVVFFREQFLSHQQHVALARQFGEPTVGHPVFGSEPNHPEIYSISKHRKASRFEGAELLR